MVIFGLVMLVLIALALQHVVNWVFRRAKQFEDNSIIFVVIGFLISCLLIYIALNYVHNHPQEFIFK